MIVFKIAITAMTSITTKKYKDQELKVEAISEND